MEDLEDSLEPKEESYRFSGGSSLLVCSNELEELPSRDMHALPIGNKGRGGNARLACLISDDRSGLGLELQSWEKLLCEEVQ